MLGFRRIPGTALGLVAALACAGAGASPSEPDCVVARVTDGDTLVCEDGRRVRLLLIDTPEMDQGEVGRRSRDALLELAPPGSLLQVETDVQREDRYGRLLAYVRTADGTLVNEELLRRGMAVTLVYPPNVRHRDRFRAVVEEAQAARRGLWATEAFTCLPVDHRAGRCGDG